MAHHYWSDADVALLRKLAARGLTSRQIADELGGKFTRNSVIGKAHRAGILLDTLKQREVKKEPEPVQTATVHYLKPKKTFRRPLSPKEPKLIGNQTFIMGLTSHTCRFPMSGEGEKTLFCGDPTEKGSWCPEHRKRVFTPSVGVRRHGEEVKLRKEADGFLPDAGAGSFRFGVKAR